MTASSCIRLWLTGVLVAVGLDAPCDAGEPQVAFTLKAGWVDVVVRQDGKPLGVSIQLLDERGVTFAAGETGSGGETAFPMPPGSFCTVEIKTGEKTADPIRLHKTDHGVEPGRVLLSYGLQPCCRSKLIKPEPIIAGYPVEPSAEANRSSALHWAKLTLAIVIGVIAVAVQIWRVKRLWRITIPPKETT